MLSNRKFINELKARIEFLEKDLESKENTVCNVLDSNKELSQENEYLRNKINTLQKIIKQHEENECRLNTELCRYKGMLDKIDNYTRMLEGRGMNDWWTIVGISVNV